MRRNIFNKKVEIALKPIDEKKMKEQMMKDKIEEFKDYRQEIKIKKDKRPDVQKSILDDMSENPKRKIILEYLKQFII